MCFISSSKRSGSVKMSRRQRKVPVSELSSTEASRRSTSWSNMGVTPLELWGRRAGVPSPSRLSSGRYGVLTMHDRIRRTGSFPGQPEIEANVGERLVESCLVNLLGIGHALDRRDQIVPCSEREIIVQVLVAIDVDLRGELTMTWCSDEEVDMCGALPVSAEPGQQLLG